MDGMDGNYTPGGMMTVVLSSLVFFCVVLWDGGGVGVCLPEAA